MIQYLVTEGITWVKVPRPSIDLVGIVLGSLGLAALFAASALLLGGALGVAFILRRRRRLAQGWDSPGHGLSLHSPSH